MAGSTPAELIAELAASFRTAPNGVRALLAPPRFGELEQVEAAKFTPPALAERETGELPASYGRTRLMLLATGPYRVFAYWDVAADAPSPGVAALRFYDADASAPAEPFDIEVDLEAHSRFVDLWSPDRAYRAELGLRRGDEWIVLAKSNVVRTPRAWPKLEPAAHFLRVEPAPPVAPSESPSPKMTAEAWAVLTQKLAELTGHREWQGEVVEIPVREQEPPEPVSGESLSPELPFPEPPFPEPVRTPPARKSPPEIRPNDLTSAAEKQFRTGISSVSVQGKHDGE